LQAHVVADVLLDDNNREKHALREVSSFYLNPESKWKYYGGSVNELKDDSIQNLTKLFAPDMEKNGERDFSVSKKKVIRRVYKSKDGQVPKPPSEEDQKELMKRMEQKKKFQYFLNHLRRFRLKKFRAASKIKKQEYYERKRLRLLQLIPKTN
jgi:hypothetical protein